MMRVRSSMIGERRCVIDIKRLGNPSIQQQSSLNTIEKTSDVAAAKPAEQISAPTASKNESQTSATPKVANQISELKSQGMSKVAELKSKFTERSVAGGTNLLDLNSTDSEIVSSNTKSKGALEFAQKLESLKFSPLSDKTSMLPLGAKQQAQIAGKKLALELPRMIAKAEGDPEKLIASVQDRSTLLTTNYAILGSTPDGDIEAMAFLVLMEASKSAQEDLKAIMDGVKDVAQAKAHLRTELQSLNPHGRKARKKGDDD